jgi:hypothetical protein
MDFLSKSLMRSFLVSLAESQRSVQISNAEGKFVKLKAPCALVAPVMIECCMRLRQLESKVKTFDKIELPELHGLLSSSWLGMLAVLKKAEEWRDVLAKAAPCFRDDKFNERLKACVDFLLESALKFVGTLFDRIVSSYTSSVKEAVTACDTAPLSGLPGMLTAGAAATKYANIKAEALGLCDSDSMTNLLVACRKYESCLSVKKKCTAVLVCAAQQHVLFNDRITALRTKLATETDAVETATIADIAKFGLCFGNMTGLQALLRDMEQGEDRGALVKKFLANLPKKAYVELDSELRKLLVTM